MKITSEFNFTDLLIKIRVERTKAKAPFEAKIGQGLRVTKWNGLNFFIIYIVSAM